MCSNIFNLINVLYTIFCKYLQEYIEIISFEHVLFESNELKLIKLILNINEIALHFILV